MFVSRAKIVATALTLAVVLPLLAEEVFSALNLLDVGFRAGNKD